MIDRISHLFPDSIVQTTAIHDVKQFCFYDETSMQYVGIPKTSVTDREKVLLQSIFTLIENSISKLNAFPIQEKWYSYLFHDGELPQNVSTRIRFIYFHIDYKMNRSDFLEAIQSLFQEGLTIVWIDEESGVFIEKETPEQMQMSDLKSLTEALLSDFYSSVFFYVGRFFDANGLLRNHFHREHLYFQIAKKSMPKENLFSFEKAFPFVMMYTNHQKLSEILEEEWMEIFLEDNDLLSTIKLFLENNSNISHTAKELYLHRNSLQYRIDKFTERTSIDVKSFHGALSVYFICLYGQTHLSRIKVL